MVGDRGQYSGANNADIIAGTDAFNNAVSVQDSAQSTIENFDYCSR